MNYSEFPYPTLQNFLYLELFDFSNFSSLICDGFIKLLVKSSNINGCNFLFEVA